MFRTTNRMVRVCYICRYFSVLLMRAVYFTDASYWWCRRARQCRADHSGAKRGLRLPAKTNSRETTAAGANWTWSIGLSKKTSSGASGTGASHAREEGRRREVK